MKGCEDPLAEGIEEEDMFDEEDKDYEPKEGDENEENDSELAKVCAAVWDEDENI